MRRSYVGYDVGTSTFKRCLSCKHLFTTPTPAPAWVRVVSLALYLLTAGLALVAIPKEFSSSAMEISFGEDCSVPLVIIVFGVNILQYGFESAMAYCSIVPLWSWKPFYVLQHHFVTVLLGITINLQLLYDQELWFAMLRAHQPLRLILISCGFTGVNEAVWVYRGFIKNPRGDAITLFGIVMGMSVLLQSILVSVPCLVWMCKDGWWPLYKAAGDPVGVFQIISNGVFQGVGFHLYLQVTFLRLQWKKFRHVCRKRKQKAKAQAEEDGGAAAAEEGATAAAGEGATAGDSGGAAEQAADES